VLGRQKANTNDAFGWDWPIDFKGRRTVGLTIEPGVNINQNSLVYAKLGVTQMRGRMDDVGYEIANRTHNGFSVGAGFKYKFTQNIYGMVEIMQTNFNRKTYFDWGPDNNLGTKPKTLTGIVGIGYTF
jgi:opacity protein-like surface antigen